MVFTCCSASAAICSTGRPIKPDSTYQQGLLASIQGARGEAKQTTRICTLAVQLQLHTARLTLKTACPKCSNWSYLGSCGQPFFMQMTPTSFTTCLHCFGRSAMLPTHTYATSAVHSCGQLPIWPVYLLVYLPACLPAGLPACMPLFLSA